ncbi:MAG TPA: FAD-dependent monooxygenase [Pseudonocardia sp.]|uniref:FAD-dependent monooxygenase n=1 Tax=Pseudonocardia sp. TaxID=60912 RepID=UPI002C69417B|nr:FAD-dependent monooxygenase [Pseudonocardia sp.]HTF50344.1 FAD-dependent monooxygenase [Pseudonocardia sp.]
MTADRKVPVLIVGAGPAGLTLSNLLSRYGVRHLLVEKHPGTAHTPRAHIVNQRTVEIFRHMGLEERLLAVATPNELMANNVWHTSLAGTELARLWAWGTGPDRASDYHGASPCSMVNCPQTLLEPVLWEAAREHPEAELLFEHEFLSFAQDADGVTARVRDRHSGAEFEVRCAYLVGADGARSRVVEQAGLPIEGESGLGTALNVWFEADLSQYLAHRPGVLYWQAAPGTPFPVGPRTLICHKPWTEFVMAVSHDPAAEIGPETEEFAVRCIREMVGDPTLQPVIKGLASWTINHQVASEYQAGRVFVMGDAVHRHPPTNGVGLNTSIADAFNLGWKLALVHHGQADATLLNSYSVERQPIGRQVVDRAIQSLVEMEQVHLALGLRANQSESDGWAALDELYQPGPDGEARRGDLRRAIELMNYQFNAHGIDLGYRYRAGAIVADGTPEPAPTRDPQLYHQPATWPGAYLPHAWLDRAGTRLSTLDLVTGTRFSLLTGPGGEAWAEAASAARKATGIDVDVHTIGTRDELFDCYGDWARLRGTDTSGAVLVRPDRHVAWRSARYTTEAARELTDVLSQILSPPVSVAAATDSQGGSMTASRS